MLKVINFDFLIGVEIIFFEIILEIEEKHNKFIEEEKKCSEI